MISAYRARWNISVTEVIESAASVIPVSMTDKLTAHKQGVANAIASGKSSETAINPLQRLPMTAQNGTPSNADELLQPVANINDIQDELASGEFVKKPDLCGMGRFNLVGAHKRANTYKGKTNTQIVFEVQLLDGDNRGARCMVSMDENAVREKYYKAIKKHGGVGPLTLKRLTLPDNAEAYVFDNPDKPADDAAAAAAATPESQDKMPF